jgi:hypothetical protein
MLNMPWRMGVGKGVELSVLNSQYSNNAGQATKAQSGVGVKAWQVVDPRADLLS